MDFKFQGVSRRDFLRGVAGAAALGVARLPMARAAITQSAQPYGARQLSTDDLQNLLYGLGFAASGGGGGYLIGQALVAAIIRDIDPSKWVLYDPLSAADDDFAVMAGGIGAPSAITPDTILNFVGYAQLAIEAYSNNTQQAVNALVPVEAGPVNALLALYLGWTYGYKVFDCDGAGRAVPSLTNLVFGYNSYPIAPVWLGGVINGEPTPLLVSPPPANAAAAEAAIRDNLGQFGDAAGLVCWGQSGAQLRGSTYLLAHTLTNLIDFGAQAAATGFTQANLLAFLRAQSGVLGVYQGVVQSIQTGTKPGYDDGLIVISTASLQYQIHSLNENMILTASPGGTVTVATAPSGIAMLFQPGGVGPYQLLNNGDNLPTQNVIGYPIIFCVLQESCELFATPLASFQAVLAADPLDYSGPVMPTSCSK